MSTLKAPNRISKRHDLREDQVITVFARAAQYFDEHRPLVYGLIAGVVAVALLAVGYNYYMDLQQVEAQERMAAAVRAYEAGSYQQALDGTESWDGLLEVADRYGRTPAGNLAHYYAGDAYYRLGLYDEALAAFNRYDKDADFLGAGALAAEAAIYEHQGDYERAARTYERAAEMYTSAVLSPQYLAGAARSYEQAGDYAAARATYEQIRENYPDSDVAQEVDLAIARVDAMERQGSTPQQGS